VPALSDAAVSAVILRRGEEVGPRLLVRPGLTGLAQVHGGRNISEDKNALDILYIRNASLWLDIKILLRTLMVLLRGERIDHEKMHAARIGLGCLAERAPRLCVDGQVEVVHSSN
jgi:hypothetical protein